MSVTPSFNGSDLGDITKFLVISGYNGNEAEYFRKIINGFLVVKLIVIDKELEDVSLLPLVVEDFDPRMLIIDNIKSYFGLKPIEYNIATISDKRCLISRHENNIIKKDKHLIDNTHYIQELKRCFAFQWLLCFKNIEEERVLIRSKTGEFMYPTSYNPNWTSGARMRHTSHLDSKFIAKWYGNINYLHQLIYDFINDRTYEKISLDIENIFLTIDPLYTQKMEMLDWKEGIMERVQIVLRKSSVLSLITRVKKIFG